MLNSSTWKENMWYEFSETDGESDQIIDNNEFVDVEQFEPKTSDKVKRILQPDVKVPKVGDYVLVIRSNPVFFGTKEEVKTVLIELVSKVDVDKLSENDIVVFERIDLEHIFS